MAKTKSSDIAVIGMSCRFPGGATNPELFWELMNNKVDAIADIPKGRWDVDKYFDPDPNAAGKMYTAQGGFLENVEKFDNSFFRISPIEAESLDPQVRILLELSYDLFENAGIKVHTLSGSSTGVFIGVTNIDYVERDMRSNYPRHMNGYSATGTQMSSTSGRISYAYGLEGPSLSLDTACSSSLTAVHLACQSLITGESQLALAGGVNLILSPKVHLAFCRLGGLSPDCRCKAFDASGNGFVRSEGAAVILLKRYEQAIRDNDNILAIIAGSAMTNDGFSKGYTVPNAFAQGKAILNAMSVANISPDDVDYFEAHGTGTPVGDPVEIEGISWAFEKRSKHKKLVVGSVKTNVGHCESAAGLAGLIKVILALNKNAIPPNLHFHTPNPAIDWAKSPIVIPTETLSWPPSEKPRYASVSSFGISGTNVNLIVREAPSERQTIKVDRNAVFRDYKILALSAAGTNALKMLCDSYSNDLSKIQENTVAEFCAATAMRRSDLSVRTAVIGRNRSELLQALQESINRENFIATTTERKKVVFVFPGQGSQWIGMGRELMESEPVFMESIIKSDKALREFVEWSVIDELMKDDSQARFGEVNVIQPVLFSIQVALATLWKSWGVFPDVVLGHSMGEIAAAHFAGALSLRDAAAVIAKRSLLARTLSGKGAMLLTELHLNDARKLLEGIEDKVSVAVNNGPRSTVLSGEPASLQTIAEVLAKQKIFNSFVKVDFASHSPQVEKLRVRMLQELQDLSPQEASIRMYSTVSLQYLTGTELAANYWVDNIRKPVLFSQAIEKMLQDDNCLFLEISPHPILIPLVQQNIDHLGKASSFAIHSLRREKPEVYELTNSLAFIFMNGGSIIWNKFYGGVDSKKISIPAYPWQREVLWLQEPAGMQRLVGSSAHPFLNYQLALANNDHTIGWETELDVTELTFLDEHRVKGNVVFPAAGFIEILNAVLRITYPQRKYSIRNVTFKHVLLLHEKKTVQIVLTRQDADYLSFALYSKLVATSTGSAGWEEHCSGNVILLKAAATLEPFSRPSVLQNPGLFYKQFLSSDEHYATMKRIGIEYGKRFMGVQGIWINDVSVLGKVLTPAGLIRHSAYIMHPVLLDACLQVSIASLPSQGKDIGEPFLPAKIDCIELAEDLDLNGCLWVQIGHLPEHEKVGEYTRDLKIYNESGAAVAVIKGFAFREAERETGTAITQYLHEISWSKHPLVATPERTLALKRKTWLLISSNDSIVGNGLRAKLREAGATVYYCIKGAAFNFIEEKGNLIYSLCPHEWTDFKKLLKDVFCRSSNIVEIVYLWGLGDNDGMSPGEELSEKENFSTVPLVYLLQAAHALQMNHSRVNVITRFTQCIDHSGPHAINLFGAPLWGLGRVVFHEHNEFDCRRIDLDAVTSPTELDLLIDILISEEEEKELVIRKTDLHVPRLVQADLEVNSDTVPEDKTLVAGRPYRFVTDPGEFSSIKAVECSKPEIREDEMEIEVHAVGLNFMNVMSALAVYHGYPNGFQSLGIEFSGKVTRVGNNVTTICPGDRVLGVSPQCDCIARYTVCNEIHVARIPDGLSYGDAAAIPVAFCTAHMALVTHGKLKAGERVLIHSATGGVGMAAIQIAKHIGAEIYATAGTEEKRSLLREMGVKYVMNSRSVEFADQIREYTNGEGIDVVLNSLSGDAMRQSLKLLRGFGRFIEIGKRDIYNDSLIGMGVFKQSISYTYLDSIKMVKELPNQAREALTAIIEHFARKDYHPIPKTMFKVSQIQEGFTYMTQGKHRGKIVFDMMDESLMIGSSPLLFRSDETFLITGGTGGLGLALAEWMCGQGAKHIVLFSRSQPSTTVMDWITKKNAEGRAIILKHGDVSDRESIQAVLADIGKNGPPLKGIFHTAGVLHDSSIRNMDAKKFVEVLRPKVRGAWNLHMLSEKEDLRYFVLFSSLASVLGSAGQSNYVAANSFLDSLSKFRRSRNRPVTCINWGPIAGIGLAAENKMRGERLASEGMTSLSAREYLMAIDHILRRKLSDISVMRFDAARWVEFNPSYAKDKMLAKLLSEGSKYQQGAARNDFSILLRGLDYANAVQTLENKLKEILASILKTAESKIDSDTSFANLGIDSLMAIQLRNRIEKLVGVRVSVTVFWSYPKTKLLSCYLMDELGLGKPVASISSTVEGPLPTSIDMKIEDMSNEDVLAELNRELGEI